MTEAVPRGTVLISGGTLAGGDAAQLCGARGTTAGVGLAVMVCHSAGAGNWQVFDAGGPPFFRWLAAGKVAGERVRVVSTAHEDPNLSVPANTWGNEPSVDLLEQAAEWVAGLGQSGRRVLLVGGSMGHVSAWAVARRVGAAHIAGIVGVNPIVSLASARGTDTVPGMFYASINEAHGVTDDAGWAAVAPFVDPMVHAPSLGIPAYVAWNADDTVIGAHQGVVEQFVERVGATFVRNSSGGHQIADGRALAAGVFGWAAGLEWEDNTEWGVPGPVGTWPGAFTFPGASLYPGGVAA